MCCIFTVIFASAGDNCFFGRRGTFQTAGDQEETVESCFLKKTSLGFYFEKERFCWLANHLINIPSISEAKGQDAFSLHRDP